MSTLDTLPRGNGMMSSRSVVVLVAAFSGFATQAGAQSTSSRGIEVSGSVGWHRLWDDESSIGTGVAGGGAISVPLTATLRLRGRVIGFGNERDFGNGVVFEATGVRYSADLLWQPSSSKYAPYFGGGIGGLSYTRRSQYPLGPGQPGQPVGAHSTFTRSGTDAIFGGLTGVNVVATDRFRLHPEVSLWLSRPGYFIVIEVGVLASYRF